MSNKKAATLFCVLAMALSLPSSSTAFAQGMAIEKGGAMTATGKATLKTIAENEKLIVIDGVTRPGDVTPMQSREGWVYHYITGGKVQHIYSDGSKDVVIRKAGETLLITEKRVFSAKNIGTTTVHSIVVHLK